MTKVQYLVKKAMLQKEAAGIFGNTANKAFRGLRNVFSKARPAARLQAPLYPQMNGALRTKGDFNTQALNRVKSKNLLNSNQLSPSLDRGFERLQPVRGSNPQKYTLQPKQGMATGDLLAMSRFGQREFVNQMPTTMQRRFRGVNFPSDVTTLPTTNLDRIHDANAVLRRYARRFPLGMVGKNRDFATIRANLTNSTAGHHSYQRARQAIYQDYLNNPGTKTLKDNLSAINNQLHNNHGVYLNAENTLNRGVNSPHYFSAQMDNPAVQSAWQHYLSTLPKNYFY